MKKGKKIISICIIAIVLVMLLTLTACDNSNQIKIEIDGFSDAKVDSNAKKITIFTAGTSEAEISASIIKVPAGFSYELFSDKECTQKVTNLNAQAETIYYMRLVSTIEKNPYNEVWEIAVIKIDASAKATGIEIKNLKNEYIVGEAFGGGLLNVVYDNGTKLNADIKLDMVTGFDTSTAGTKTLTIKYKGFTVTAEITVNSKEAPVVTTHIKTDMFIKNYNKNSQFINGKLDVIYSDGTKDRVDITEDMVIGFDTSVAGKKEVTIKYGDFITKEIINVVDVDVENTPVAKTEISKATTNYAVGDVFENGILSVTYADGSVLDILITKEMLTGFDTSTAGEKTVVIDYQGQKLEVTINVVKEDVNATVVSIELADLITDYSVDEANIKGSINVTYSDGRIKNVIITSKMVTGFDTATVGKKDISIDFGGKKISAAIVVELEEIPEYIQNKKGNVTVDTVYDIVAKAAALALSGNEELNSPLCQYNIKVFKEKHLEDKQQIEKYVIPFLQDMGINNEDFAKGGRFESTNEVVYKYAKVWGHALNTNKISSSADVFKAILTQESFVEFANEFKHLASVIQPEQLATAVLNIQKMTGYEEAVQDSVERMFGNVDSTSPLYKDVQKMKTLILREMDVFKGITYQEICELATSLIGAVKDFTALNATEVYNTIVKTTEVVQTIMDNIATPTELLTKLNIKDTVSVVNNIGSYIQILANNTIGKGTLFNNFILQILANNMPQYSIEKELLLPVDNLIVDSPYILDAIAGILQNIKVQDIQALPVEIQAYMAENAKLQELQQAETPDNEAIAAQQSKLAKEKLSLVVTGSKLVTTISDRLDNVQKESIVSLLKTVVKLAASVENNVAVDNMVMLIKDFAKIEDVNVLNDEEVANYLQEFMMAFGNIIMVQPQPSLNVVSSKIIIKKGTNVTDFKLAMKSSADITISRFNLETGSFETAPVTPSEVEILGEISNTEGINTIKIKFEGLVSELSYYVYDETTINKVKYSADTCLIRYGSVVAFGNNDDIATRKEKLSAYMDQVYLRCKVEYCICDKYLINVSKIVDINAPDVTIEGVKNDSYGVAYIVCNDDIIGQVCIPFEYVSSSNPSTVQTIEIGLEQDTVYYIYNNKQIKDNIEKIIAKLPQENKEKARNLLMSFITPTITVRCINNEYEKDMYRYDSIYKLADVSGITKAGEYPRIYNGYKYTVKAISYEDARKINATNTNVRLKDIFVDENIYVESFYLGMDSFYKHLNYGKQEGIYLSQILEMFDYNLSIDLNTATAGDNIATLTITDKLNNNSLVYKSEQIVSVYEAKYKGKVSEIRIRDNYNPQVKLNISETAILKWQNGNDYSSVIYEMFNKNNLSVSVAMYCGNGRYSTNVANLMELLNDNALVMEYNQNQSKIEFYDLEKAEGGNLLLSVDVALV